MQRITLKIEGMACGMCESHINSAVRNAFNIKKIVSSHSKGETVILAEAPLDVAKLRAIIDETGYKLVDLRSEPYEKKHFWTR